MNSNHEEDASFKDALRFSECAAAPWIPCRKDMQVETTSGKSMTMERSQETEWGGSPDTEEGDTAPWTRSYKDRSVLKCSSILSQK